MFQRIRYLLAAFDRGEFDLEELLERLDRYTEAASREPRRSRNQTTVGLAAVVLRGEP